MKLAAGDMGRIHVSVQCARGPSVPQTLSRGVQAANFILRLNRRRASRSLRCMMGDVIGGGVSALGLVARCAYAPLPFRQQPGGRCGNGFCGAADGHPMVIGFQLTKIMTERVASSTPFTTLRRRVCLLFVLYNIRVIVAYEGHSPIYM
jgi:hypothetical protein